MTMKNKKLLKYFTEQILPILDEVEFNDTEQESESMWTISVNYNEYAVGIYATEQEAERIVVKYIRGDEPDLDESSDQELLDSNDGYYRVLEIKETES